MAVITPGTEVILLKVPLEISEDHQLTFASLSDQYAYFSGLADSIVVDKFTYARKDGVIRVPYCYDDVLSYNYVMYRNTSYGNKWFYAFITGAEYLNDNATALSIKTDVFQTYQFDLTYKPCFVEREHVNVDTVGTNTVPENLELGEYKLNGTPVNSDLYTGATETNACYICFQVSDFPDGDGALSPGLGNDVNGHKYGGVYSGLSYILVLTSAHANALIKDYDLCGKSNAIVAIFSVPLGAINANNMTILNHTSPAGNITTYTFNSDSSDPITFDTITISSSATIDGYAPKNNKLFCWPFSYFYATNNSGTEVPYHWEDFSGTPTFKIEGAIAQGISAKAYPTNYKGGTNLDGYNFGITCGKLPICAWNSDYYTNWCTQNAINQPISVATSVAGAIGSAVGLIGGALTGGATGLIAGSVGLISSLSNVGNAVSKQYEASITPDQAKGNANCGDINIAEKRFGITLLPMSIKAEYARICDEYLSTYGYKINRVKIPNITGRRNWNFVKTVGCYITADIPQEDLQEIKSMFDKGITLWHNTGTFLDYSQTNDIIS